MEAMLINENINLSNLNNYELLNFFRTIKKCSTLSTWNLFNTKIKKTLSQERVNKIDSFTWRKLINLLPNLAYWCNNEKLESSDISNIFLAEKAKDLLITEKISNKSIKYVHYFWAYNKKNKISRYLKLNETKKQFKLSFPNNFDFELVVKLFVFDDKTLNNMGYSFDLSNNEKFLIVNKEKTNKNSKEFLVIINQIIKDNLFNLNPII